MTTCLVRMHCYLNVREKKNNNSGLFQRIKLTHISKDAELR